jgi:hypothetical protein
MAVDYSIQYPCAARKQFGAPRLATMVKKQDLAEFAIARYRDAEPETDVETIVHQRTVNIGITRPDGTVEQSEVPIVQLLALAAPLQGVVEHCRRCPANIVMRNFGCINQVNYPIPLEAEEWLLSRLPDDAGAPTMKLLFKFLAGFGIDGTAVDTLRQHGNLFESKQPVTRIWKGWLSRKQISSSQILQMLVHGGPIGSAQASLYAHILNLSAAQGESRSQSKVIEQLKTLMRAVVVASRHSCELAIDA